MCPVQTFGLAHTHLGRAAGRDLITAVHPRRSCMRVSNEVSLQVRGGEQVKVVEIAAEAMEDQDEWGDMNPEEKVCKLDLLDDSIVLDVLDDLIEFTRLTSQFDQIN